MKNNIAANDSNKVSHVIRQIQTVFQGEPVSPGYRGQHIEDGQTDRQMRKEGSQRQPAYAGNRKTSQMLLVFFMAVQPQFWWGYSRVTRLAGWSVVHGLEALTTTIKKTEH